MGGVVIKRQSLEHEINGNVEPIFNNQVKTTLIFTDSPASTLIEHSTTLKKILSRGNTTVAGSKAIDQLFSCFGISKQADKDLPVAAATARVDFRDQPLVLEKYKAWMRADPVFLQADLTTVRLFDSQHFKIEHEEVQTLFALINPLLVEFNLELISGADPARWYIGLEEVPAISTTAPTRIDDQNIQQFLPQGKERAAWVRLGNEIQMLLHNAEINQQRAAQGDAPINGVWFWGAGQLPDQPLSDQQLPAQKLSDQLPFNHLLGDDVIAQGLAIQAGIPVQSITADLNAWIQQQTGDQHNLIVLLGNDLSGQERNDPGRNDIEQSLFQPLLNQMKKGNLKSLELITDDLSCTLKPSHLLRFWRS